MTGFAHLGSEFLRGQRGSVRRPLERSLVAVGLLAATSAAFCLGRRSWRGLNFCRSGVLVGCAHDASAAEQGQRCSMRVNFFIVFVSPPSSSKESSERHFTASRLDRLNHRRHDVILEFQTGRPILNELPALCFRCDTNSSKAAFLQYRL
jgi:hypothetical protein